MHIYVYNIYILIKPIAKKLFIYNFKIGKFEIFATDKSFKFKLTQTLIYNNKT